MKWGLPQTLEEDFFASDTLLQLEQGRFRLDLKPLAHGYRSSKICLGRNLANLQSIAGLRRLDTAD